LEVIKALLSFLSYVFHGLLCLILFAISGLAMVTGAQTLQLGMLPWTGSTLLYTLFFGALLGLVTVLLAIKGRLRPLFFVWSLVVTILLLKGYIFSGYRFVPGDDRADRRVGADGPQGGGAALRTGRRTQRVPRLPPTGQEACPTKSESFENGQRVFENGHHVTTGRTTSPASSCIPPQKLESFCGRAIAQ
jgi:hypothetical protein